jgi:hypothetical protein
MRERTARTPEDARVREKPVDEEHVRRVRIGSGGNCSSVGSVVDTLFATAVVGAAIFAGVVAALKVETIHVREPRSPTQPRPDPPGATVDDPESSP